MESYKKFNSDLFIASTETKPIIHLKVNGVPLGNFCKCGCGKRLVGKIIKRKNWRTGIEQEFQMPVLSNQVFFSKNHKNRYFEKRRTDHKSNNAVDCRIRLSVENDKGQYRKLTVYLKKGSSIELKILPEYKELWQTLEKIAEYRKFKVSEKIIPTNLLSIINLNRVSKK